MIFNWLTTVEHPVPDRQLHLIFKHWKSSEPDVYTKEYLDDKYQKLKEDAIKLIFIEENFEPGQDREIKEEVERTIEDIQSTLWENYWYQNSAESCGSIIDSPTDGFHRYYYDFTPFQRIARLFGYELHDLP